MPRATDRFANAKNRALAIGALRRTGWKVAIAAKAVDSVLDERGVDVDWASCYAQRFRAAATRARAGPRCRPGALPRAALCARTRVPTGVHELVIGAHLDERHDRARSLEPR